MDHILSFNFPLESDFVVAADFGWESDKHQNVKDDCYRLESVKLLLSGTLSRS
jgi:hypothetical protein